MMPGMNKENLVFGKVDSRSLLLKIRRQYRVISVPIGPSREPGAFFSDIERLRAVCGERWDADAFNLLNVMCALRAADRYYPSVGLFNYTRRLNIAIQVTDPDRWRVLTHTLQRSVFLLSGDRVCLLPLATRRAAPASLPVSGVGIFKILKQYHPDCVCLFSGGADSFCGVAHLISEGRRPLLVSHAVGPISGRQHELFAALRKRFPQLRDCALLQFAAYPRSTPRGTPVPRSMWRQRDDLQRLRSIFFFSFAAMVARAHDIDDVFMCENGIIGAAIIFAPNQDNPNTTRPAEPHYLRQMQNFLRSALNVPRLHIRNPFQYMSKGEILRMCAKFGFSPALHRTVSCWRSGNRGVRNCGECVPCMFRQLAFDEAGLPELPRAYYGHKIPPLRWKRWRSEQRWRLHALRDYCSNVVTGGRAWLFGQEPAVAEAIDVTSGPARQPSVSATAQKDLDEEAPKKMARCIERFARATLARLA